MTTPFITNDKGENLDDNLSEDYKSMIDAMLEEEVNGQAEYVSLDEVKNQFYKV
jgi:hypothetical protein